MYTFIVTRLDEKENEMKKEYNKLHERYTELFKTHMDHMERTKLLIGADRIMDTGVSPKGGYARCYIFFINVFCDSVIVM